jgi:hypothetical protein
VRSSSAIHLFHIEDRFLFMRDGVVPKTPPSQDTGQDGVVKVLNSPDRHSTVVTFPHHFVLEGPGFTDRRIRRGRRGARLLPVFSLFHPSSPRSPVACCGEEWRLVLVKSTAPFPGYAVVSPLQKEAPQLAGGRLHFFTLSPIPPSLHYPIAPLLYDAGHTREFSTRRIDAEQTLSGFGQY